MRIAALMLSALALGGADEPPKTAHLSSLTQAISEGKYGKIIAVEAEQHGVAIWSRRFDGKSIEHLHDIRSAGKSLTALAVGLAIAEGKLASVDSKVWPLLGSMPSDRHNDISVRDLLTMSSALDCDDANPKPPGYEERMYRTRDWRAFAMTIPLDRNYRRDSSGFGRFSYCTAGVFLLGRVVEKVTGEPFDNYMARRIFTPLGIDAVQWRLSPIGEVQSGGQIKMRATDLARIGRLVLDHGRWRGNQIIPESWIREMLTPYRDPDLGSRYGYLWWLFVVQTPMGPQPSWMMSGNGGNFVAIFREYDAVIVVQSATYNNPKAGGHSFEIIRNIVGAMPAHPAHAQRGQ